MPSPNAEVVRRFLDLALGQRDIEAAIELAHLDAEFDWSGSRAPYRVVYRGVEEAAGTTDLPAPSAVVAPRGVVGPRGAARGKGSGVTVQAGGAGDWRMRDGTQFYAKLFQSKEEALAAVNSLST